MNSIGISEAAVALNSERISVMKADSVALYHQRFGRINGDGCVTGLSVCDGAIPDCDDPDAEPLSMASALGVCAVELEPGEVYQPWTTHIHHCRGTHHSLNDGLRDTRWRRADRAVKRWFRGAARYLKGCVYCGIDEVGHFVLKVIGAGLTLYAVAAVAVHFYG